MTAYRVTYNVLVNGQLRASADATITVAEALPIGDPARHGEAIAVLIEQLRQNPHPDLQWIRRSSAFIHIQSVTEILQ